MSDIKSEKQISAGARSGLTDYIASKVTSKGVTVILQAGMQNKNSLNNHKIIEGEVLEKT